MRIDIDTHTHTLASDHAYSSIYDIALFAKERGLKGVAITDHAPAMIDSPHELHFLNYPILPRQILGVNMLYGVELNILDFDGKVDLNEGLLKKMDICIASFHTICTKPGNILENTNAYLNTMSNPYVDIIGHPGDGYIPADYDLLARIAKEKDIALEINNSSLKNAYYRKNVRSNLLNMLGYCKKYSTLISVGSDAHYAGDVGSVDLSTNLIEDLGIPKHQVINSNYDQLLSFLRRRRVS